MIVLYYYYFSFQKQKEANIFSSFKEEEGAIASLLSNKREWMKCLKEEEGEEKR